MFLRHFFRRLLPVRRHTNRRLTLIEQLALSGALKAHYRFK